MAETAAVFLAGLSLALWAGLMGFRGGFWRADQRLPETTPELEEWPGIVCVIPARNEAETISRTVGSLFEQDYPGPVSVIVVDDNSDDGTAEAASGAPGADDRLTVVTGRALPPGWSGKLWAVHQGLKTADERHPEAPYVLFTDADIVHDRQSMRRLAAKAEIGGFDLVSLMVLLHCEGFWERFLIPAFVFFFQKLFPFAWINDPSRSTVAAAGGCMLVRRQALNRVGGIDAIRDSLIDDCALAAEIKKHGAIWLGLTSRVRSERPYDSLSEIWRMVSRTAFEQLGNSPFLLIGTVAGMGVIYLAPPLAGLGLMGGGWAVAAAGLAAWGLMVTAYAPMLRLYGLPMGWGLTLPLAAVLFTLMTVSSAKRYWLGRGSAWKGRHYGAGTAPHG
jgi:hopene-associated glycosyltransferase HpnB